MAAPLPRPAFAVPTRSFLPTEAAAKEWDKLAEAHQLRDVTKLFLKANFGRIELFAKLADREMDALPSQMDLQGNNLSAIQITVELASLRMIRDQINNVR